MQSLGNEDDETRKASIVNLSIDPNHNNQQRMVYMTGHYNADDYDMMRQESGQP